MCQIGNIGPTFKGRGKESFLFLAAFNHWLGFSNLSTGCISKPQGSLMKWKLANYQKKTPTKGPFKKIYIRAVLNLCFVFLQILPLQQTAAPSCGGNGKRLEGDDAAPGAGPRWRRPPFPPFSFSTIFHHFHFHHFPPFPFPPFSTISISTIFHHFHFHHFPLTWKSKRWICWMLGKVL